MKQTSIHISGFWHHISWQGEEGVDQHGFKWVNPDNPRMKYGHAVIEVLYESYVKIIQLITKGKLI